MRAMILNEVKKPLILQEISVPAPDEYEVLIEVHCCAVCRTELHIIDNQLPTPHLPLIPGHQIVGTIVAMGKKVTTLQIGMRVGVPWLGYSCSNCSFCCEGRENLCDAPLFTGYHKNGGYAEYCTADHRYVFTLPKRYSDLEVAPLLCAGLIGYRALKLTEGAKKIGFFGFGSSAHILTQLVSYQGGEVYAFIRPGNEKGALFAKSCGAIWTGTTFEKPPLDLDAAILFAPLGEHYPIALQVVKKGGVVVSAGIHMSDIPSFPYKLLWEERVMRSVANLTREDGKEFFALAEKYPLRVEVHPYPLERANEALEDLRLGRFEGSLVLKN